MVTLTHIVTRGGDKGETSLIGGARVMKDHARIEAIGEIDEVNAVIGIVRLHAQGETDAMLARVQQDLFDLGADVATPYVSHSTKNDLRILSAQVLRLEEEIAAVNAPLAPLTSFVLPGGSEASAFLHLARTSTRKAERRLVALMHQEEVNPEALRYLNRLSDLFFVLARAANDNGGRDVLWQPGINRN